MDKLQPIRLPIEEANGMCAKIAATVLNWKGYEIPIPSLNCIYASFVTPLQTVLARKNKHLEFYQGTKLNEGMAKLVKGENDGFLYLSVNSNPHINHYIAFIVESTGLNFYDANDGLLDVYRLRQGAMYTDFNRDLHKFLSNYELQQVVLIVPNAGGKRKRRKTRRKTRKHRR
jgi:hypothetical protein